MTRLYLGTHQVNWLWSEDPRFEGVTLFVSRVRLAKRKTPFPRALHSYCIDSGGFTELQRYGRWTITAEEYVAEVRRYLAELGPERCRWVAPQDWMCEDIVIRGGQLHRQRFVGTHLSVIEHQRRTVANAVELRELAPEVPFILVLQGQTLADYERCARMYADAGFDLANEPVIGLGSVCRRQATEEIAEIARAFSARGYRLHGFGVKILGLSQYAEDLISADSMAWSKDAFHSEPLPGHTHKSCANCPDWAIGWHTRINKKYLGGV